jgi:hypothetical protein
MGRKNGTKGTKLERKKKTEEKLTLRMKNIHLRQGPDAIQETPAVTVIAPINKVLSY